MVRNPDPKPGRWILPLVVLGMVFFTWAFVQRLEPEVIADDAPISSPTTAPEDDTSSQDPGSDAGTDDTSADTTPTTLPPELESFLAGIISDQEDLVTMASAMDTANAGWDADEISYGETEAALIGLRDDALAFRDAVVLRQAPAGFTEVATAFEDAIAAAEDIASAADAILDGLRASDTGQARRSALLDFRTAVEAFNQAVTAMEAAAQAAGG
ncbi:MAG: hypothetical protein OEM97_01375 [Acidimicrobiia bacterium]|nr:hypothetical protein [Acidimicrobiia bacterium]